MDLYKAIELLHDLSLIPDTQLYPDYIDAIKLGIQALYLIKRYRADPTHRFVPPLPGELNVGHSRYSLTLKEGVK